MASGRLVGAWRKVHTALLGKVNPAYTEPGMDTPERKAEKQEDLERSYGEQPKVPGEGVPSTPGWTSGWPGGSGGVGGISWGG